MSGFELSFSFDILEAYCLRLSQTLLHFLWQGCVIGLLALVATRWLRRASANTRYLANTVALGLMAACLTVTFVFVPMPEAGSPSSDVTLHTTAVDWRAELNGTLARETPAEKRPAEDSSGKRSEASFDAMNPSPLGWPAIATRRHAD